MVGSKLCAIFCNPQSSDLNKCETKDKPQYKAPLLLGAIVLIGMKYEL